MFPKAQQGGSHSPGTAGIRLDPGLEQLSMGFPWDVPGVSRQQGKPLGSLGVQRRQENLDFLGGFSIRNTHRDVVCAPFPDRKSLGEIH